MAAPAFASSRAQVFDLLQHRLQLALRERVRYRYVKPTVLLEDGCYRVQSPCCSRRIDPNGGLIDIALLVPQADNSWRLCARDRRPDLGHALPARVPQRRAGCVVQ